MRFGGMSRASRSIKFLVGILSFSTALITLSAPSANADSSTFNFSITYAAGDGSGVMAPQTGTDTLVSLRPSAFNPPAGKHFTGWQGDDSNPYADGQTIPLNADLTLGLTAQYAVNTYTYSISYGSGAGSGGMGVQSGSDTSFSLTPSSFTPPTGEHFTGWLGSDNVAYIDGQEIPLTADLSLTLTAQFAPNLYTYAITYDPGVGSGSMGAQSGSDTSVSLTPSSFTPPAGEHFTGWLGSDSASYTDGQNVQLNSDLSLTLTAQWTSAKVSPTISLSSSGTPTLGGTITFTAVVAGLNGESAPSGPLTWSLTGSGGATACIAVDGPIVVGVNATYTCTVATPNSGSYSVQATYAGDVNYSSVPPTFPITVNVTPGAPTFTVTFNSNGATSGTVPNPVSYQDGDTVTIDASNTGSLAHEGQTFFGWSGTNNGSSVFLGDPTLYGSGATTSFIIHSNVTLYAQFIVDSYLAYDANGGTGSRAPDAVVTNWPPNHLTLPDGTGFTKDGYTFGGWTKVKDDASTLVTTYGSSDLTGASGDTYTVYALWTPIPVSYNYSITYAAGNGTGAMDTQGGTAPSIVLASNSFVPPSGEHFTGWSGSDSLSYSDGQSVPLTADLVLILTAQYAANPPCYTVVNGVLTDGTACAGAIIINSSVTSIGDYAFWSDTSLTSVDIPESVTSIGASAFLHATSLTSVVIPSSVTSIGDASFDETALVSVELPFGVLSIGDVAFADNPSLISVMIPNSVTSISGGAFENDTHLTSVVIPVGVTSVSFEEFYGDLSLNSVLIPDGVTSIGSGAFEYTALSLVTYCGTST